MKNNPDPNLVLSQKNHRVFLKTLKQKPVVDATTLAVTETRIVYS